MDTVTEEPIASPPTTPIEGSRSTFRVLVVDDMEISREIAASFLRFAGHRVDSANSGTAAVALAETETFDLILMDILMPGMNGLEATRRIRALPPPHGLVPIVALSAQAFDEQVTKCRQAGMTEHISKPFEQATLVALVERVAAEPTRQHFVRVPSIGRGTEVSEGETLLDRTAMAETNALIRPGDMPKHFEGLVKRAEALLDDLQSLQTTGDRAAIAIDAHRLGGAWGMFGFNRLAGSVRRFEAAIERNEQDITDESDALVAAIREAIDIVRREILVSHAMPGSRQIIGPGTDDSASPGAAGL